MCAYITSLCVWKIHNPRNQHNLRCLFPSLCLCLALWCSCHWKGSDNFLQVGVGNCERQKALLWRWYLLLLCFVLCCNHGMQAYQQRSVSKLPLLLDFSFGRYLVHIVHIRRHLDCWLLFALDIAFHPKEKQLLFYLRATICNLKEDLVDLLHTSLHQKKHRFRALAIDQLWRQYIEELFDIYIL